MQYLDKNGLPTTDNGEFCINMSVAGTYTQALALSQELKKVGGCANITVGGVQLTVTDQNRAAVEQLLEGRGINVLHKETLMQQIAMDGGLELSAIMRPKGQAAAVREEMRRLATDEGHSGMGRGSKS